MKRGGKGKMVGRVLFSDCLCVMNP